MLAEMTTFKGRIMFSSYPLGYLKGQSRRIYYILALTIQGSRNSRAGSQKHGLKERLKTTIEMWKGKVEKSRPAIPTRTKVEGSSL